MLVWGRGVGSGVEEAIITLRLGTRAGGKEKMAPARQIHICNKMGEGEVRRKSRV